MSRDNAGQLNHARCGAAAYCHKGLLLVAGFLLLVPWVDCARADVALLYNSDVPQAAFAAGEIGAALEAKGEKVVPGGLSDLARAPQGTRMVLASSAEESRRVAGELGVTPLGSTAGQSYALRRKAEGTRTTYVVLGADPVGAMYGGLDLAEAVRLGTLADLQDSEHTPYIARRGIKFNIPLDARTPSYSDAGDAAQQNIPEMWSLEFWREFLDELAR
ncbi:MAG: hypothetical protein FJ280_28585, partial [Planctomycetes bacterium]|nr:hypothetical protein [Planctomycetota bacterium]